MYGKISFELDKQAIGNAIDLIVSGKATKVEISRDVKIYKVSSQNPKKYTIRMDIKEEGD